MELIAKYIPVLVFDASQVPNVLDKYAVDWHQLWCHNWAKDFPYQSFPLQKGDAHWQLTLIIPDSAFFLHHINYLSQREMRCNLYKCGDLLAKPHYMSWNPVHSEKPNFHRPQDFDTCIFE